MTAAPNATPSDDVGPVEPEEKLLRRIPPHWYPDPQKPNSPQWIAFRPTKDDADGLSVNRRRFVASLEAFSYTADRTQRRSVAQVKASQVISMGLSVLPRPLAGDLGHAVIPELNASDYNAGGQKKRAIKEWALKLVHEYAEMVLTLDPA